VASRVPQEAPLQTVPFAATVQTTPLFAASFVTVAVNSCWAVTKRVVPAGVTETEIFWACTIEAKSNETEAINKVFSTRMFLILPHFFGP
jgi:uncharacterized membrane protein YadS